jgi:hypothetical protein
MKNIQTESSDSRALLRNKEAQKLQSSNEKSVGITANDSPIDWYCIGTESSSRTRSPASDPLNAESQRTLGRTAADGHATQSAHHSQSPDLHNASARDNQEPLNKTGPQFFFPAPAPYSQNEATRHEAPQTRHRSSIRQANAFNNHQSGYIDHIKLRKRLKPLEHKQRRNDSYPSSTASSSSGGVLLASGQDSPTMCHRGQPAEFDSKKEDK